MRIGNRDFDVRNQTYVMGILNVTPDSFSDGGHYNKGDALLRRVEEMVSEGADLIDIGGESTKPGYAAVSEDEELSRVLPAIEAIKARFDIPLSLDTYKAEVAKAGAAAGISLINDVYGFGADTQMAKAVAESGLPCCLMHGKKTAAGVDFLDGVVEDLGAMLEKAREAGILDEHIILDPGVGFDKTLEENLKVIRRLDVFHTYGYPVLLGTSRKSVIGQTLNLPVDERVEGTLVTTVIAVQKGVTFVRVHDVGANVRAVRMTRAILGLK